MNITIDKSNTWQNFEISGDGESFHEEIDKIEDMKTMSMKDFLMSYNYIKPDDYIETLNKLYRSDESYYWHKIFSDKIIPQNIDEEVKFLFIRYSRTLEQLICLIDEFLEQDLDIHSHHLTSGNGNVFKQFYETTLNSYKINY